MVSLSASGKKCRETNFTLQSTLKYSVFTVIQTWPTLMLQPRISAAGSNKVSTV